MEGLGQTTRVVVGLHGDRIQISLNDTLVAQLRNAAVLRGTFGCNLRPGDAPAIIELADAHVIAAT